MASRLLSLHRKLLVFHRYHKCFSVCLRYFSSQNRGSSESFEQPTNPSKVKAEPVGKWLNIRAAIFGPDDERLPLPGDVGLSQHLDNLHLDNLELTTKEEEQKFKALIDKLYRENKESGGLNKESGGLNKESGGLPASHFNKSQRILTNQEQQLEAVQRGQIMLTSVSQDLLQKDNFLECKVQNCPDLLKKDFQTLFPNINVAKQQMTVISLCRKTVNDMSVWSEAVELEREELVDQFVDLAHSVCKELRSEGYWADFIDPTSGRPFLGPFTNATFFETDERYRQLGFTIEDLGCCKVISHRTWGSRIFIGALFTSAPVNSEVLKEALSFQWGANNT